MVSPPLPYRYIPLSSPLNPLILPLQDDFQSEFAQEQGVMDLDPSHDQINGPMTPASQGLDRTDDMRMTSDIEENKVKYTNAARELTSNEADSDSSHHDQDKIIPANDFEAMKAHVLESPGDLEILHETYFTWEIKNYGKLNHRSLSPEFECGGFKWRILYFPWGNNQKENSSAYLEAIPPEDAPADWHVCAQFALVLYNPTNPTKHRHLAASHRFYAGETDWGFTGFLSVRGSYVRSGHNNDTPIAKGGNEANLTAYVRIVKDPSGVLWHNFRDYDSRKQTGYVGLRNQGATCYMNSLLQSLYFTNTFRKIVFRIPTEGADPIHSLSLALQRVFVQLQTAPDPVSTTGLTQSFGWDSYESFVQHDAQEFERVLLEGLEKGMKEAEKTKTIGNVLLAPSSPRPSDQMQIDTVATAGKLGDGTLQDQLKHLFCGKMESYIRCVNVDYESRRGEEFWDIQLNVKGHKDLRASFEDLIAVEMMDGENQYRAEGYGLQDAEKGVAFLTFPPINDRYEFPLEIDLSDFLAPSADKSASYNYKLHGVLVHSGDVHGGHYFGMIKPKKDSKWYRYDDERVIPVTIDEVLEENFGGDGGANSITNPNNGLLTMHQSRMSRSAAHWKRFTSAYMLVYFREDAIDELLSPITPADIPAHVVQKVEEERVEAARRKREKEEMHLFITIRIIDAETFRHHEGVDLVSFDPADKEALEWIHSYRVRRDLSWVGFYQHIAETYKLERDHIRLWHLVNRQNKTIRPDVPIPPDPQLSIEGWLLKGSSSRSGDLRLYLERSDEIWHPTVAVLPKRTVPSNPPPPYLEDQKDSRSIASGQSSLSLSNGDIELENANGDSGQTVQWPEVGKLPGLYNARHDATMIMIFLKWFDVESQRLRGQRTIYVNRHDKTGKLTPIIAEMMSWRAEAGEPPVNIAFYEEIKPGMIEPLKPNATFLGSEIQDGDIVCFMRAQSSKRTEELLKEGKYPDPVRYYEFLYNKIILKFIPRYTDQAIREEFQCVLAKNMKYDQVAAKVAEHLKVPPTHLRFTSTTADGRPRSIPIKRAGPVPTVTQMTHAAGMPLPPIVFYEVLELSLVDMESKREITVTWLPDGVATMDPVTVLVSRQASFEEVVQSLVKKQTNIPPEVYDRIRLFDIRGHKEYREFQPTQALSTASIDISYGTNFFAEPIPLEEDEAGEHDRFVIVIHFAKEISRLHGVPLKFVVKPRELWFDTKKRLQKRLGYKDKEFAKIKFFLVPDAYYNSKVVPLEDEEVVYDRLSDKLGREFIALDHPDRSPGRKLGFGEKALSIKS